MIQTNNRFDLLVEQFNTYKNLSLSLSLQDKKVLREYQELGVQWLYHLYKCGFGGLLADEMGLGKSIQLIYLIKLILKEKSDAKILIVAPTSLIYNWSQEFSKFGSEINYKVFAESKEKRKQELEALENVQVLITTYGLIRQDQEQYLTRLFNALKWFSKKIPSERCRSRKFNGFRTIEDANSSFLVKKKKRGCCERTSS